MVSCSCGVRFFVYSLQSLCSFTACRRRFKNLMQLRKRRDIFEDGNHHVRSFASRHVRCTCFCDLCRASSDLRSASARDVCSTRGELHSACSQLHCTSTSGDVRCAAPSNVRGCCSRGDVRRASGQLRASITDHRDLLSYVTFLLPQRQLTSLRGPTAFRHAHVRLETVHRFGCTPFRAPESRIASEFQRAASRPSWLFTLLWFRFDVSWRSRHKVRVLDSGAWIFLERR